MPVNRLVVALGLVAAQFGGQWQSTIGRVIDGSTGVQVESVKITVYGADLIQSAQTDATGHFKLSLPPGEYQLVAAKSGYCSGGLEQRSCRDSSAGFIVSASASNQELLARVWKYGSVGGMVLTAAGDSIVGADVQVMVRGKVAGHDVLKVIAATRTDGRGIYRFDKLPAGDYVMAARTSSQNSSGPVTFWPGSPVAAAAGSIALTSGQNVEAIDIRVVESPGVLHGVVRSPDGLPLKDVALLFFSDPSIPPFVELEAARIQSSETGAFALTGLNDGRYLVRAITPTKPTQTAAGLSASAHQEKAVSSGATPGQMYWAERLITVSGAAAALVEIQLEKSVLVSGRIRVTDPGVRSPPAEMVSVLLRSLDERQLREPIAIHLRKDGSFGPVSVIPGSYAIAVSAPGFFLQAVQLGSGNQIGRALDISQDVTSLECVIGRQASTLTGAVRDSSGGRPSDATVLIFPVDSRTWETAGALGRILNLRPAIGGTYRAAVIPGTYFVVAIPGIVPDSHDPVLLRRAAVGARTVTVTLGSTAVADVEVGPHR